MSNKLDKFESLIKNKVEGLEFEYNPSDWSALEQNLPKTKPGGGTSSAGKLWLGAAAFVTLVTISGIIYLNSDEKETPIALTEEIKTSVEAEPKVEITHGETNSDSQGDNAVASSEDNASKTKNVAAKHVESSSSATDVTEKEPLQIITPVIGSHIATLAVAKVEILPFDNQLCVGETVVAEANQEVKWYVNDQLVSTGKKITLPTNKSGKYGVLAKVGEVYKSATYEVIENPEIHPQSDLEYIAGWPIHTFKVNIPPNWSAKWNIEGETMAGEQVQHSFLKAGYFNAELEVTNHFGCVAKETISVRIENEAILLAPLAFTCNNDNLNERYIPESLKYMEEEFIYEIYSKVNGKLMYRAVGDASGWDGRNHFGGQDCPTGEYTWKVIIKGKDGKQYPFAGNVNLLK